MPNRFDQFDAPHTGVSSNRFDQFDVADSNDQQKESKGRGVIGVAKDTGASIAAGVGNVVKSAGDIYGVATGDYDNPVSTFGGEVADYFREARTPQFEELEQARQAKVDAADGTLAKAGTMLWETIKSPTLWTAFLAEQAPMLIPAGVAGRGAAALSRAAGASQRTAAAVGTGGAVGAGATMQGAEVASGTYDELLQLPDELWEQNDDLQRLMNDGLPFEDAKTALAERYARGAGLQSGAVSVLTNALPGARILERRLAGGRLTGSRTGNTIRGFVGESIQEGLEEAGGQALSNINIGRVDTERDWEEGVGEALGMGAAAGPFGAVAGAARTPVARSSAEATKTIFDAPDVDTAIDEFSEAVSDPAPSSQAADPSETAPATEQSQREANPIDDMIRRATRAGDTIAVVRLEAAKRMQERADQAGAAVDQSRANEWRTRSQAIVDSLADKYPEPAQTPDGDLPRQSSEIIETWTGRRGDGYQTMDAAQAGLRTRERIRPDLEWQIEQMPSGKFQLVGYSSIPNEIAPAEFDPQPEMIEPTEYRPLRAIMNPAEQQAFDQMDADRQQQMERDYEAALQQRSEQESAQALAEAAKQEVMNRYSPGAAPPNPAMSNALLRAYLQADTAAGDTSTQPIEEGWEAFAPETGTLDIPRAKMPQIKAEHRGALVNFLKGRGISSEKETVPASSLKPTQREFSPEKVQQAREYTGGDRSILVSSDGYVIDGHHQWLSKLDQEIDVIRIDAPIQDALEAAREFPSSGTDAPRGTMPTQAELNARAIDSLSRQVSTIAELRKAVTREMGADAVEANSDTIRQTWNARLQDRRRRLGPDDTLATAIAKLGGLGTKWREDITGDTRANKMVPGVGPMFRQTGTSPDDMATKLHEAGYIPDTEMQDSGGVDWLYERLADELAGRQNTYPLSSEKGVDETIASQEDQMAFERERLESQREAEYASIEAEYGPEAAQLARQYDEAMDNIDEDLSSEADYHEQQIQQRDQITQARLEESLTDAQAAARDEQLRQADDQESREPSEAGGSTQAPPGAARPELDLTSQTESQRQQSEQVQAAATQQAEREQSLAAREAQRQSDAKNDRARAEATVDGFELGKSADEQLSGINDLFSQPQRQPPSNDNATDQTASQEAVSVSGQQKIEDLGEKIGGARKDVSTPKKPGSTKKSASKGWRGRYRISEIVAGNNTGKFAVFKKSGRGPNRPVGGWNTVFDTQQEAEDMLPVLVVGEKHWAMPARDSDGNQVYEIWRRIGNNKRVKVVDQQFPDRMAAMTYMAANAEQIIETNTTFGEADLPKPDNLQRVGAQRRQGNVDGQDFMDTFGLRGVEFGNWNNQDERQQVMNEAYDGLLDLAEVLGIPAKAIGLNGDLALAFGARGQGLNSARAHYERDKAVINLTKMQGAGALAHEWFHALDHYFGRQDGKASSEWVVDSDGTRTLKARIKPEGDYVSHGFKRNDSGVRQELRDAYEKLIRTMFSKAENYVKDTQRADDFVARTREDLAEQLDRLRADLSEQKDPKYWKRKNKPASAEQLAEFDTIAKQFLAGEMLETETRQNTNSRARWSFRWSNDALDKISEIYKDVRGSTGFDKTKQNGVLDSLRRYMGRYSERLRMLADAQKNPEGVKSVPTDFAMSARELDQGRGEDYWTTPHEMAARAFQGYVEDKIAEQGGRSPFLNYAPENAGILTPWGWKPPYPRGDERKAINKEFDNFVSELRTRETDSGVALFSRSTWNPERYNRVMPRDLFNEAKTLSMHLKLIDDFNRGKLPEGMEISVRGNKVDAALSEEGELYLPNFTATIDGQEVNFTIPYNAGKTDRFPLYATDIERDAWSIPVYDENGNIDPEFIEYFGEPSGTASSKQAPGSWTRATEFYKQLGVVGLWEVDMLLPLGFEFDLKQPERGFQLNLSGDEITSKNLSASLNGQKIEFYMGGDRILKFKRGNESGPVIDGSREMSVEFREMLRQAAMFSRNDTPDLLKPLGESVMIGDEILVLDTPDLKIYEADPPYRTSSMGRSFRYVQYKDGKPIGAIQFLTDGPRSKKAVIQNIHTDESVRRQGVAARLLRRAQQDYQVRHSDDLTAAGRAFKAADGVRYSMSRQFRTQLPLSRATGLINAITSRFQNAPDVIVVQSMQDQQVPEAVRREDAKQRSQGASGDPEGFYYQGKAYIVLDGLTKRPGESDVQALFRVFAHEVLGHAGLRGLFRGDLEKVLQEVAMKRRGDIRRKAEQYGLDISNRQDRMVAAEEVLAEMAQSVPDNSMVTKAVEAVRRALRRLFMRLPADVRSALGGSKFVEWVTSMTDAEIIDRFIVPAREYVRGGQVDNAGETAPAFQRTGDGQPQSWYRSDLQQNIGQIRQMANKQGMIGKAQAKRWIESATKKGLFKAEEVQWTGLIEFIDMAGDRLPVEDIQAFVDANGVQVQDVVLSEREEFYPANSFREPESGEVNTREYWQAEFERIADEEGESLDEMLDTLEDVSGAMIDMDGPDTKYSEYQLPGGENYREVLLTLPTNPDPNLSEVISWYEDDVRKRGIDEDDFSWGQLSDRQKMAQVDRFVRVTGKRNPLVGNQNYISAHWEQPNILAHIRMNDRTDADGSKVLFIEEIQSDWAQDGRKKGFKQQYSAKLPEITAKRITVAEFFKQQNMAESDRQAWLQGRNEINSDLGDPQLSVDSEVVVVYEDGTPVIVRNTGNPDHQASKHRERYEKMLAAGKQNHDREQSGKTPAAPFVGNTKAWTSLALKRIMAMAVEGGYDKVAFINGEQSADRYDLSKKVSAVSVSPTDDGKLSVSVRLLDGRSERLGDYDREDLAGLVGKELADRIIADESALLEARKAYRNAIMDDASESEQNRLFQEMQKHQMVYEGLDLRVGGDGMRAFYDQIIPQVVRDVLKRVGGGRPETTMIDTTDYGRSPRPEDRNPAFANSPQMGITITDVMRRQVSEGLPLFARAGRSGSDREPWPADFPKVPFAAPLGAAAEHPSYEAAKSGDVGAAKALVDDLVTDEAIEKVRQMIGDSNPIVVPVSAIESGGDNWIPLAYGARLASELDLEISSEIVQSVRASRTNKGADYRLATHAVFDGPVEAGRNYLIVDDTMTMGGTLANLRGHIESGGGNVIGGATLTGFGDSGQLALTEKMRQDLWRKHGDPLNEYLQQEFGYGIDSLTQGEAGHFRKAVSLDAIRDRITAAANQKESGKADEDVTTAGTDTPRFSRSTTADEFTAQAEQSPWSEENRRLRESDRTLWNRAKKLLRKNFSPGGLLPDSVFREKIARDGKLGVVEITVQSLVYDLEKAIRQEYSAELRNLNETDQKRLSGALAGKMPANMKPQTAEAIVGMRQYLDKLSAQYASMLWEQVADMQERGVNDEVLAAKVDLLNTIVSNQGEYVHRSYQVFDDPNWFKRVDESVVDSAREYLISRALAAGESQQRARERAEVVLSDILKNGTAYDSMESFIKESKLGAKDLSILKRRKDIAPEIRALMGEYIDPRINFAKSATKMGRLIFNQRFLDAVREQGMGTFLFTEDDRPTDTEQIAADGSEVYAPLNGLYTYKEVAQAMKDALGREQMSAWYKAIVQINGLIKGGKTILSPTTSARNFQSAMFFSIANGHFDLTQAKKSMSLIKKFDNKQKLAYVQKMKDLGVIYDAPYAEEMMDLLQESRADQFFSNNRTAEAIRASWDFARDVYSFGDDFWKIIGFENEKALLLKHTDMTVEQAEKAAADRIRNTYPTYSMVGKAIQWLRRFPLVGTFVSFPAEIIRTTFNMAKTVRQDWNTPGMRPIAARRALGMSMVAGFAYAAQEIAKAMFDVDDEDEEAIRIQAAPWQQNSNLVITGRDEDGNLRYVDISFLDPYNYFKRPITAMMRDQPFDDAIVSAAADMLSPFLGTDIAAGALMEIYANKTATGGQVFKVHDSVDQQLLDIADHLRKAVQPGIASNLERTWKAMREERTAGGKKYDLVDEGLGWIGWRVSTLDPRTSLYYRSFDFSDAKADATRTLSEVLNDPNQVSDRQIVSAYERSMRMRSEAYRDMITMINSSRRSGLSDQEIVQVLRSSNVSQADARALMSNQIPPWRPTRQSEMGAVRRAEALMGREKAMEIRDRYRRAITISAD